MEYYLEDGSPRLDLEDGVYFDLPEDVYFAQPRLGSSDLQKLHDQRFGWWWGSAHNPNKAPRDTSAQTFGRALHKLLLEGPAAYLGAYAVAPDPADYQTVLSKVTDYQIELASRGIEPKPRPALAQDWLDLCRLHIPDGVGVVAWPNVIADFHKARGAKLPIEAAEHRNLMTMYDLILNSDSEAAESLRKILAMDTTFPNISELSFLWTCDKGLKRRSRFDKLVPNFTLDLKSLSNWAGRPLDMGISDHILRFGYDVQMADYQVARLAMHKMIKDRGDICIWGGTTEQRVFLEGTALKGLPFEWVWLFYQIPDANAGRAPVVFPVYEHWRGPFHTSGHRKAFKAADIYLEGIAKFGLDNPWGEIRGVHYTKEGTSSSVFLSSWGWDLDGAVANEDDLLTRD